MKDISLKDLLEAGCHFGHKKERWHPKAAGFIYTVKEGIHIIDLAKTRDGLKNAAGYIFELGENGKNILIVATKRQAKGIVAEAAKKVGLPYLTNRWIGGFLTNWEEVKKNLDKVNRMRSERTDGSWQKFPKHEIIRLEKELRKLELVYAGVAELLKLPDTIFIVDIKREEIALREAQRKNIPVVAMIDTNADPDKVEYAIPANDDAVGSIKYIVDYITEAYDEGRKLAEKKSDKKLENVEKEGEKIVEKEKKEKEAPEKKAEKAEKVEKNEKAQEPVKKAEKIKKSAVK
jgi:small subunit ribosomal protein S2